MQLYGRNQNQKQFQYGGCFGEFHGMSFQSHVLHCRVKGFIPECACCKALLYGLEACPLRKSDISSLDFVVNRFFMKLFQTKNIDIVNYCRAQFEFDLPSTVVEKRSKKSVAKYRSCENVICKFAYLFHCCYFFLFLC